MPLITSITTFKKYVRIVFTSTDNGGLPNMERADRKYLVPVLGQTVYAALLAQVAGTVTWTVLLDICRCYVAPMAMLAELPTRNIQITDSGLKKTTSQDMENVFRWEYLEMKEALEAQAAEALDELWQHLFTSGADYTWTNTSEQKTVIKTAIEFKKYYRSLQHSFRVFAALQPVMVIIQDQFLIDAIGAAFFKALTENATPTDIEKEALDLLKKAAAYLTIMAATEQLPSSITPQGFTVLMSGAADAVTAGQAQASAETLSTLRSSCEKTGTGYVQKLKEFLNAKATAEIMPIYFGSDLYTAPGTTTASPNAARSGVFGLNS